MTDEKILELLECINTNLNTIAENQAQLYAKLEEQQKSNN